MLPSENQTTDQSASFTNTVIARDKTGVIALRGLGRPTGRTEAHRERSRSIVHVEAEAPIPTPSPKYVCIIARVLRCGGSWEIVWEWVQMLRRSQFS